MKAYFQKRLKDNKKSASGWSFLDLDYHETGSQVTL
jgi:hypothetical protein